MPYKKLTEQRKFTNKEIKQMWDDLRIRAAWYSMVVSGKRVYSTKLKKEMTEEEIVKQFSKLRAILWALGYPLKSPKDKNKKKTKKVTAILYSKAIPLIKKYLKELEGKVSKV